MRVFGGVRVRSVCIAEPWLLSVMVKEVWVGCLGLVLGWPACGGVSCLLSLVLVG